MLQVNNGINLEIIIIIIIIIIITLYYRVEQYSDQHVPEEEQWYLWSGDCHVICDVIIYRVQDFQQDTQSKEGVARDARDITDTITDPEIQATEVSILSIYY